MHVQSVGFDIHKLPSLIEIRRRRQAGSADLCPVMRVPQTSADKNDHPPGSRGVIRHVPQTQSRTVILPMMIAPGSIVEARHCPLRV
jgi:hypothetical protein